jgi:hypothetical protein
VIASATGRHRSRISKFMGATCKLRDAPDYSGGLGSIGNFRFQLYPCAKPYARRPRVSRPFFGVPVGRIRLNAFGRQVYLGCHVEAVESVISSLTDAIEGNVMVSRCEPTATRRGTDVSYGVVSCLRFQTHITPLQPTNRSEWADVRSMPCLGLF